MCYNNPSVDWITPETDSIFLFGDFIEVLGNFTTYNNESSDTYTYGWKIIRYNGLVDISIDAVKPYYQTDIRKMHLDNNVIQPNNYYNITFFVKGDSTYYKGLYSELTHNIYVGMVPKNGKCSLSPLSGISTVTPFNMT